MGLIYGPPPPSPPTVLQQLVSPITGYILANPLTTALRVAGIMMYFFPVTAWMPACLGVGFSALGPAAGLLAPALQSVFGTPGVFRTLQSAMMGGYGMPILDGVVRWGAVVGGGAMEAYRLARWR